MMGFTCMSYERINGINTELPCFGLPASSAGTGALVTSRFLCANTLMLTVACIFIVGLPEYNEVTINTSCSCEQVQFLKYIEVIKIIYQENG